MIGLLGLALAGLFLTGCASISKTALVKGQENIDVSKKSVGLLYVKVANEHKPGYQPKIWFTTFERNIFSKGSRKRFGFKVDAPYKSEKNAFTEYLLTVGLEPGVYDSVNFMSKYHIPILMTAEANLYLKTQVEIKPNTVVYLGHIDAVIRKRTNDAEVRAGPVVPIVDQAVAGFYTGTFGVSIRDEFDSDMQLFTREFPGLQKAKIEKAVIPASSEVVKCPF